jgi:hypothetical protein
VVAGQLGQRFHAFGAVDLLQEVADQRIQLAEVGRCGALGRLEFEDGQFVPAVAEHVEMAAVRGGDRAHVIGAGAELLVQLRRQAQGRGLADHLGQRPADGGLGRDAGPVAEVGAGLQDFHGRGQGQQEAVRLDAAGRANRLPGAGGQVEFGNGRSRIHVRGAFGIVNCNSPFYNEKFDDLSILTIRFWQCARAGKARLHGCMIKWI